MGKLMDEVAAINITSGSSSIDNILRMLDEEDRDDLLNMIVDPLYTGRVISKALTNMGPRFAVSERTVQRYRQDLREVQ